MSAPEDSPAPFRPERVVPTLPSAVSEVLAKGLSPGQDERYASAGAFAAALREAASAPLGSVPLAWLRSSLPLAALAACLLLALGVWLVRGRPVTPAPVTTPAPATTPAPPLTPVVGGPGGGVSAALPPPPAALPLAPKPGPGPLPAPRPSAVLPPPNLPPADLPPLSAMAALPPRRAVGPSAARRPTPAPAPARCHVRVYARQFVTVADVMERRVSAVGARRVLVDGNPSRSLAAGLWTALTPGSHRLAFYPTPGVPFDPNTKFWVRVGPGRRAYQIPLPRHPGGIRRAGGP